MRRFDAAVDSQEKALSMLEDFRTAGNLGRAYFWAGRKDRAHDLFERAVALGLREIAVNPKHDEANVALADYYSRLGRRREALDHLGRARLENPHFMFFAAMVHVQLGDRHTGTHLARSRVGGWSASRRSHWMDRSRQPAEIANLKPPGGIMKVAPFVVIVLAATLSVAAQPKPAPLPPVLVKISIGQAGDQKKECNVSPTTVYVIGTTAYHCIDKKLIGHAEEGKNKALEASYVKVAAGQRVQWVLKTHTFRISAIEAQSPIHPDSPGNPFNGNFPETREPGHVRSGGQHRRQRRAAYKVTFNIVGVGLVDPDVVCSM